MLLFLFATWSVFLSLQDVPKKVFLVIHNGRKAPRSDGTEFSKRQNFFFHRNKDLYVLFLSLIEPNNLFCFFLCLNFFFCIFVKCFWQFGCFKFRSWCDCKLAIIKPSVYRSTYCLLIKWLIFSCRVKFYGSSLR